MVSLERYMYSIQKYNQFSQENSVVGDAYCNIDGFLWRDSCVPSTLVNRQVWIKESHSLPIKTLIAGSIPSKNTINSPREKMY
jgi:hypothetical protein